MFTRPFRFCRADDLAEASELLRRHGEEAKVIAGGQSLMPLINLGLASPSAIIDISRAGAFAGQPGGTGPAEISYTDGYLTIGALVTHARLAADPVAADRQPLLGAAAARIGSPRVRNRGTLGGSLAHSDPAAELPLAMTALGAEYEVSDGASSRTVRAEEYHLGFLTTAMEPDELVIAARVPALGPGWGWAFEEFSRRDGDFALAAAAALVRSADGIVVESRVAVGGVADRPVRLADIETALSGAALADAGSRIGALRGVRPVGDAGASAAYREHLAEVLIRRAVAAACQRSAAAA
jgi:aerobic carbon-monoxide dehydrogenase medium subunit